jgi:hypothetical protein
MPPLQMPPIGLAVFIGAEQAGHTFNGSGSGIVFSVSFTRDVWSRLTLKSSTNVGKESAGLSFDWAGISELLGIKRHHVRHSNRPAAPKQEEIARSGPGRHSPAPLFVAHGAGLYGCGRDNSLTCSLRSLALRANILLVCLAPPSALGSLPRETPSGSHGGRGGRGVFE